MSNLFNILNASIGVFIFFGFIFFRPNIRALYKNMLIKQFSKLNQACTGGDLLSDVAKRARDLNKSNQVHDCNNINKVVVDELERQSSGIFIICENLENA